MRCWLQTNPSRWCDERGACSFHHQRHIGPVG